MCNRSSENFLKREITFNKVIKKIENHLKRINFSQFIMIHNLVIVQNKLSIFWTFYAKLYQVKVCIWNDSSVDCAEVVQQIVIDFYFKLILWCSIRVNKISDILSKALHYLTKNLQLF